MKTMMQILHPRLCHDFFSFKKCSTIARRVEVILPRTLKPLCLNSRLYYRIHLLSTNLFSLEGTLTILMMRSLFRETIIYIISTTSFVNGCLGDLMEARRRWQITKKWRKTNDVDNILSKPQPHFETIKRLYPHGVHRCSDSGNWIYIERPGYGKLDEIFAAGITMEDVERHYTFITEYLWRVVDPSREGQLISIFDVEVSLAISLLCYLQNFALTDLAGDRLKMLRRCSALVGVNNSSWMSFIFRHTILKNLARFISYTLHGMPTPLGTLYHLSSIQEP